LTVSLIEIDVGAGDLDLGQLDRQLVGGAVPAHIAVLKLRQVKLIANVAREDQRPLRADETAEPLLLARYHRDVARCEDG